MLGFRTAQHVLQIGRGAFFSEWDSDLPVRTSEELKADDLVPQFGFVGPRYLCARVLLLGINPGNGPKNAVARSPSDAVMMPVLSRFAENPTPDLWLAASAAYRAAFTSWFIDRHVKAVLGAASLRAEDVAYTNALPWRTGSESRFSRTVEAAAATGHVAPLLEELRPCLVIALGLKAAKIVERVRSPSLQVIPWTRERAPKPQVIADRENACRKIRAAVQQ